MINQTENKFLDISKLLAGETDEIVFDRSDIPFPFEEEISVSSLHFSGRVFRFSEFVRLSGTVTGEYSAPCARCLAPVKEPFSIAVDCAVGNAPDESDEETVTADGQVIDPESISQETVLIHLPLRLLCREDCKGLCPKCGMDLNSGSCGCAQKEIDPRLAGLADFFKD